MRKSITCLALFLTFWVTIPVFSAKSIRFHQNKWNNYSRSISSMPCPEAFIDDNNQDFSFIFYNTNQDLVISLLTSTGSILHVEHVNTGDGLILNINLNEPLLSGDYILSISNGINTYYGEFTID